MSRSRPDPSAFLGKLLEHENAAERIKLVACKTCFEVSIFGEEVKDEKPYNALYTIRTDVAAKEKVKGLLDFLLKETDQLPDGCIHWDKVEQLG